MDNKLMCKYCEVPIYIKSIKGDYLELPNNVCPMCGEKIEFAPKEHTDNTKELNIQ